MLAPISSGTCLWLLLCRSRRNCFAEPAPPHGATLTLALMLPCCGLTDLTVRGNMGIHTPDLWRPDIDIGYRPAGRHAGAIQQQVTVSVGLPVCTCQLRQSRLLCIPHVLSVRLRLAGTISHGRIGQGRRHMHLSPLGVLDLVDPAVFLQTTVSGRAAANWP
jgi:hypothetical protein